MISATFTANTKAGTAATGMGAAVASIRARPDALVPRLSPDEREAHEAFVATLGENAIWHEYLSMPA